MKIISTILLSILLFSCGQDQYCEQITGRYHGEACILCADNKEDFEEYLQELYWLTWTADPITTATPDYCDFID